MELLSIIIPSYNEEENIPRTAETLSAILEEEGIPYELVFVDDGSRDGTYARIRQAAEANPRVQGLRFSRNFGKEAGIYAGLQHAAGEYICLIDADLQQRPEIVRDMVKILDEEPEFDVVAAFQDRRGEGKVLSFFKKCFYSIINKLSKVTLQPDASDFRTFRRSVRDSILELAEYHRFSKGIFSWVGFNTYYMPYIVEDRANGTSKWNFAKLFKYAMDGIIAFTTTPLKIATYIGLTSSAASIIYMIVVIIQKLAFDIKVPGYATTVVLILLLGGLQLFCTGMVGEYLARTYIETKHRPIYIAREVLDYEDK